ncbi:MAG: hypothetical protein D6687_06100 [Acidobacteria bacterium]|jgi:hypothetical protein|nr:MAG: hypothetical protein D6687_06100 [Acidobacteriota bacterium]GIU82630.1 MAG: hypothetical protein KatS3mg006_1694 [Pyrinomonadaceae bacterium]
MALKLAGLKDNRQRPEIRIENQSSLELPKDTEKIIKDVLEFLPSEHIRGVEKVRLVDFIKPPQVKVDLPIKGDLPGLYHPKVGGQAAWFEVSMGALLQPTESFAKRWMAKSTFKGNLAALLFSLAGQHYFLTMKHSVKKQSLESQVRQYTEKNLREWGELQQSKTIRGRLFKPLRPYLERLSRWLSKKAIELQKKSKSKDR